jgi:PST family polysaccharide transporter
MGLRDSATHAVKWASFGWVTTQAISFVTSVITARLLAPELFGLITLILVIVSAASIFADAGTRAALVQFEEPIEDAVSTALLVVPVVGAVATAVVASLSTLIADFYDEPRLTWLAVALSGLLFLQALQIVPDALLQRRFNLRLRRGLVDPLSVILYGTTVVVFALLGFEEWSLVIGQYVAAITITAGTWALARPSFRAGRPSYRTWRRIGRYGRHLLTANIIEVINSQGAPVTLGRNVTPTAVGLYGAGSRLSSLPITGITHVAGQVIFPALSRLQHDAERFRLRFLESLRLISLLTIPLCVTLIALGEPIVVTLFGERWRGGGEVLQILGVYALGLSLIDVGREVFKASGQPRKIAQNALLETAALLGLLALIWVTGHVTIQNVAWMRALSVLVALVTVVTALRGSARTSPLDLWRAVRPSMVAGAVQCAAVFAVAHYALSGLDTWRHVGGLELGPVVPLVMVALLALAGGAVYVAVVETAERGALRELVAILRTILRRGERGEEDGGGTRPATEAPATVAQPDGAPPL